MRDKDRALLHAAARLLGVPPEERGISNQELDDHDWGKFLLAKDMYRGMGYDGPEWVPFQLWQAKDHAPTDVFAEALISSPGARELWDLIAQKFDRPNDVAIQLPMRLAEASDKWRLVSKRTPADHREHCLRMKANALALATELDAVEARERFETGEVFDFMRLYDSREKEIVYQNVAIYTLRHGSDFPDENPGATLGDYLAPEDTDSPLSPVNKSAANYDAGPLWELLCGDDEQWPGIVPTLPGQLRRLAAYFDGLSNNPPLMRPTYENAERNFVSRYLCAYFQNSYGFVSPTIVARVISIFFAQGITDNEVSQQVAKLSLPAAPP